jgi:FtsH-binding integral membrane protein
MTNFDVQSITQSPAYQEELAAQRTFMARVFGWMTVGLLITALIAVGMDTLQLQQMLVRNQGTFLLLLIVQFGVAMAFSFLINKIPAPVSSALFVLYSAITGVVFSILFLVYTSSSIASTFFITAGMFGTMAVIGYTTKKDLTSLGMVLVMALIGLIIASLVNMFLMSSGMYWLLTFGGVVIFTGLTAYDTQRIKQSYAAGAYGSATFEKTAVYGAFSLYLDFINLFIYLLRFLGRSRN